MPEVAQKKARISWQGELRTGSGSLSTGSGVLKDLTVTFPNRLESDTAGNTSPEELIAAAHATCYAMVLTNALASGGNPAEQLEVEAVCHLDRTDAGLVIRSMDLHARARVPRMEAAAFEELARTSEQRCPVSNALRNNVEINLTAELM